MSVECMPLSGAARKTEPEFRCLLDVLPAAAYTCDTDGLITYFNRRAANVWGREPALNSAVDRYCGSFKLLTSDGAPIRHEDCWMARALLENREYNGYEIVVERPDGSRRTALAHANPFRDRRGAAQGAVNVLVDITVQKQAEAVLRQADQRKNEFLAILAHELRNPLAPIRNGLQILELDGGDAHILKQAREMLSRQVQQIVRLVDDLMDVSCITRNQLVLRKEPTELTQVLQSALEACRPSMERSGQELEVALPTQPVYLHADAARLAQVFSNLLSNAAKYTGRGGKIRLAVARDASAAVVSLRDTGVGMSPDMLDTIFEPFTQADRSLERVQGGLGIGLSLVRGLVAMHGGTVEAHSDGPGEGSLFVVRLPLADPAPAAAEDTKPTAAPSKRRVLVVDDNKDSAVSMAIILNLLGHETCTVYDGIAAVEAAESFRPDLVLLDIGLPRLNGYDAARRIRAQAQGRSLLLIAMTGWGQAEDKRRSAEAGFDLHLVKPVDPAALERVLAGHINEGGSAYD